MEWSVGGGYSAVSAAALGGRGRVGVPLVADAFPLFGSVAGAPSAASASISSLMRARARNSQVRAVAGRQSSALAILSLIHICFSTDGAAEPNRPVLYTLEEVTG